MNDSSTKFDLAALLVWHRRYLALVAALEATGSLVGVWIIAERTRLATEVSIDPVAMGLFGGLWSLTLLFLAVVHVAAMRTPREPWAWSIHAVLLALDLTTLVLWPFALPLLWIWLKHDTQRAFGRTPRGR